VRRMTLGELLKYRKGLCIARGYGTSVSGSSQFGLTLPAVELPDDERVFAIAQVGEAFVQLRSDAASNQDRLGKRNGPCQSLATKKAIWGMSAKRPRN
jgi:hypothetical protein